MKISYDVEEADFEHLEVARSHHATGLRNSEPVAQGA